MGDKWAFLLGRGYGHGVGMCQCGAQAMARQGKTARQILFYYYPGSNIVRVY
jgi:stage II sporulation protein D